MAYYARILQEVSFLLLKHYYAQHSPGIMYLGLMTRHCKHYCMCTRGPSHMRTELLTMHVPMHILWHPRIAVLPSLELISAP